MDTSQTTEIGTFAAEKRQIYSFDLPATVGGQVDITVTVGGSNTGTVTETETITVRTKRAILQQAKQELERLRTRVTNRLGTKGLAQSLTSKLDAAIDSIERATADIDAGHRKQGDNAISTATNQLGALLNSLAGKSKKGGNGGKGNNKKNKNSVSGTLERVITNRVEVTIDQLSDARTTPLTE